MSKLDPVCGRIIIKKAYVASACITKKEKTKTECVSSLALCEVTSNVSSTVGVLHSVMCKYYHMDRISVSQFPALSINPFSLSNKGLLPQRKKYTQLIIILNI